MFWTSRHGEVREGPDPPEGTFSYFFSGSVRAPNRSRNHPPGGWFRTPWEGVPGGSDRGSEGVSGTEIFDLGSTSIRVENLVLGRGDRRVWDPPY
jgi:hypothetical protein